MDIANNSIPDYYRDHGPSRAFMVGFHGVCRALFHPRTIIDDDTREIAGQYLEQNKSIVYSLSHASWFDPVNYAAVIQKQEPLNQTIGNIVIPANAPLFNGPFGGIITLGGAKPIIRRKDLFGKEAVVTDVDKEDTRRQVNQNQTEQFVDYVNGGRHTAYFPEGTRNNGDRTELLRMRRGMLELIKALDRPEDALIVMMSICYGDHEKKNIFHPTIAVGHIAVTNAAELTMTDIQAEQQRLLDLAYEAHRSRLSVRYLPSGPARERA